MRLPPIAPTALSPAQRALYEDMKAGVSAKYDAFVTMRDDGALLGPWRRILDGHKGNDRLQGPAR
jgi:4-carboxymuconolactone decarboxylase